MLFCDRRVFNSEAPEVAGEFDELAVAVLVVDCVVVRLAVAADDVLADRLLLAEPEAVADEPVVDVDPLLLLPLLVPAAEPNPPPPW